MYFTKFCSNLFYCNLFLLNSAVIQLCSTLLNFIMFYVTEFCFTLTLYYYMLVYSILFT